MPAPTNISFLTATDLGALPATVTQQVDDSGTIYTVYYSFTAPTDTVLIGVFGFGDLTHYKPVCAPYAGPASAPTAIAGGAILGHNVPMQFPVTAGEEYFLEISKQFGATTPANLSLLVQVAPNLAVPAGSLAVNDDNDIGLPLALLSKTADYTALKYIADFPSGEGGDVLINGTCAVEDISNNSVKVFNSSYQQLASHVLTPTLRVRTCLGANKFYLATNENPTKVYSMDGTGTLSAAEVLTAMTSCNGMAANNLQTIFYHAFTGNGVAVRTWDLVGHAAGADLAVGIANYAVIDILCPTGTDVIVGYYKSSVTRDYKVLRYSAAGATLSTYASFAVPIGSTAPRLAYAIDDPNSFWVMMATDTAGITTFYNVKISDGSFLTTRNQEQFENGEYGGTATATPLAYFGAAFSCPFWITRVAAVTTETFTIRRQRRWLLPSSDSQRRMQIPLMELLLRTGIGLLPDASGSSTPLGVDPEVRLRISKDGGKTWQPERVRSAGLRGEFKDRVRWTRATGNYRNAVGEVTVDAPVDWQWLAMVAPNGVIEGSS